LEVSFHQCYHRPVTSYTIFEQWVVVDSFMTLLLISALDPKSLKWLKMTQSFLSFLRLQGIVVRLSELLVS